MAERNKKIKLNQKICTIILLASFLAAGNTGILALAKEKQPSKQLQGGVVDYKVEYINANWWEKFNDPILRNYIFKALNENHDLRIATLKVSEFQSLVRESLGKELPQIGIGGNFGRQKTSDNIAMGSFKLHEYTQNAYTFPLTASYELDLWLKNRDKTLSMAKQLESVKYDEKSAYISLTSAVATSYFNAIKLDKLVSLQENIINRRKEILDLTKEKNTYGLCPTTDVINADKALTEAQSSLNDLKKYQSVFLNQLAVLTGQSTDNSLELKRASIDDIQPLTDLPAIINSDVVLKRPDVLSAEAQLQKSRIDVRIARKDFLPNISLTGQFGFNANSLNKVFTWDSYIASIGAGVAESIFTGGQRRARLMGKNVRYQAMFENYQKAILQGFQEVNDSLVAIRYDQQKNNDNLSRIAFEKKNLQLIDTKYKEGAMAYLDTLQYKERLLSLQKEQTVSKTDCLIDSLSLYKAVGAKIEKENKTVEQN